MAELKSELFRAAAIPLLMIWGTRDRLVDLKSAEILGRHFKNFRLAVIDNAGHLPYEEVPERFCPPVQKFLEAHSSLPVSGGK
jgi:pimeloyl-ACP methyl ester carboxylesterase